MDIKFNYDDFLIMDCEKFLSISHCFFPVSSCKNRIMLSVLTCPSVLWPCDLLYHMTIRVHIYVPLLSRVLCIEPKLRLMFSDNVTSVLCTLLCTLFFFLSCLYLHLIKAITRSDLSFYPYLWHHPLPDSSTPHPTQSLSMMSFPFMPFQLYS